MLCFRDKTFCSAACLNTSCDRLWTDELQKAAEEWMKDPPIAFADFSSGCPVYEPAEPQIFSIWAEAIKQRDSMAKHI